ncbi:MAG: YkgJ family cysteine cluster protein [Spirochaetes bacterium]|nr:YkgJ family cysteine cluster protein [Spirochaetota bacterium]
MALCKKELIKILNDFDFNCLRCSNCCRIDPGAVFLSEDDFNEIIKFLKIDTKSFLIDYCRPIFRGTRQIVALKEKTNYDCIFWDNKCTIYEARPLQCKAYPFWASIVESDIDLKKEMKRCKGIGRKGNMKIDEKINFYYQHKNFVYKEYKI